MRFPLWCWNVPHYDKYAYEHVICYIVRWIEEVASSLLLYALRWKATLLSWVQPLLVSGMVLGHRLLQPLYQGFAWQVEGPSLT